MEIRNTCCPSGVHNVWSVGFSITKDMSGFEYALIKFSDDPMLSSAVDLQEGMDVTQMSFRLEKWAHMNLVKFGKARYMVLACTCIMAFPNICTDWEMNRLGATLQRRTWGYWWMKNWPWDSNVCFISESRTLGFIKRSVASRSVKVILPLCTGEAHTSMTKKFVCLVFLGFCFHNECLNIAASRDLC